MADPVPQMPPVQQYVVLTLEIGSAPGTAKLTLQGPKVPGIGAAPAIGVSRDAQGNYHFLIGVGDHVYRPEDVPSELRRMFGDSGGGGSGPPKHSITMPARDKLLRSDGSFKSYDQYLLDARLWHSPVGTVDGTVWPILPLALYQALIDFYSGGGLRPVPGSSDYGDYPVPAGDTSVA